MAACLQNEDGSARCLLCGLEGAVHIELMGGAVIVSVCLCGQSSVREEGEVVSPGWGSNVGCCFVVVVVVTATVVGTEECGCDAVRACSCDCLD